MQTDPHEDTRIYTNVKRLVSMQFEARGFSLHSPQSLRSSRQGRKRSSLHGRGLDFKELRAYHIGDDVRTIDWKVTSRLGRPHVRSFEEEKEKSYLLVVDQRRCMFFGSQFMMKSTCAAELGALFSWSIAREGDRVGWVIVGDREVLDLKPARNRQHLMHSLGQLCRFNRELTVESSPTNQRQLNTALHRVEHLVSHDMVVVVISDMCGWDEETIASFRRIGRQNSVLVFHLTDPLERDLPTSNQLFVSDGDLQIAVDGSDRKLQTRYRQNFEGNREELFKSLQFHGVPTFPITSSEPVTPQVRKTLASR